MKFIAAVSLTLTSFAAFAGGGTAVPEPGIWGLLGVAGVALAVTRFFNKKK